MFEQTVQTASGSTLFATVFYPIALRKAELGHSKCNMAKTKLFHFLDNYGYYFSPL